MRHHRYLSALPREGRRAAALEAGPDNGARCNGAGTGDAMIALTLAAFVAAIGAAFLLGWSMGERHAIRRGR